METADGPHVLRRVNSPKSYLDYQVRVLRHLASSDFPYAVPTIVQPNGVEHYIESDGRFWLLYRFIEGRSAKSIIRRKPARMGAMVAHFDRSIESLDLGPSTGRFILPLFEPGLAERIEEGARWLSTRRGITPFGNEDIAGLHALAAAYSSVSTHETEGVRKLPRITVYNDWHPGNIVYRWPRIRGLIDFDSLVEAPRIVDFQNALMYVFIRGPELNLDILSAFSEGYRGIVTLASHESTLIYPVLLDRIAWLVVDIIDEIRRAGDSRRDRLAIELIRLSRWADEQKESVLQRLRSS